MKPEELRLAKQRMGVTNAELARDLGIPFYTGRNGSLIAPTISRWLNGRDKPPPYLWRAIAHLEEERRSKKPQQ